MLGCYSLSYLDEFDNLIEKEFLSLNDAKENALYCDDNEYYLTNIIAKTYNKMSVYDVDILKYYTKSGDGLFSSKTKI